MLALALLVTACRDPRPEPTPVDAMEGTRVRLGTFNVRRFFDPVCDSQACGVGDYEEQPSPASFEARADELAAAILGLDADAVALEEIETQTCLDALLARLPGWTGVLGEIGDAASVDVAVVARLPLGDVVTHRATTPLTRPDGTPTQFSRELLEVHLGDIVLVAAHFKAKSDDDPGRRLAEAQASAEIILGIEAPLVVLAGDLNDTPNSPPLLALTNAGLVRVAADVPISQQGTYEFNGNLQAIDHILVAPGGAALRIERSSRTWRDGRGYGGSDHAALTSDFVLPLVAR